MHLTPRETDVLHVYAVAELARRRRGRGVRLNVTEAAALVAEAVLEAARDGRTVAECMELGRQVVGPDDVLPGVPERLPVLQVEATFVDGTKLVTCHEPVGSGGGHGAGYLCADGPVTLNAGRRTVTLRVSNTGDRAVQVGSHYHFHEVNDALEFDRAAAAGMRLDVPAGTAVRFEPGDTREVTLCEFGGDRRIVGFSGRTDGTES